MSREGFESTEKIKQRLANFELFWRYAPTLGGKGIFLPERSTEVDDFNTFLYDKGFHTTSLPSVYLVERDYWTHSYVETSKPINGIVIPQMSLYDALRRRLIPDASFGHIDFCGLFNSSETRTAGCIEYLARGMGRQGCFAFTHTYDVRCAPIVARTWVKMIEEFSHRYPGSLDEFFDFDSWYNWRGPIAPAALIAHLFAKFLNFSADVQVIDSVIYGNKGTLKMNRCAVAINRDRDFDSDAMIQSARRFHPRVLK